MIVFLIALLLLCLVGIRFRWKEGFADYCAPAPTGAIKGIFVVIVLLSHVRQYVTLGPGFADQAYREVLNDLGQLMVAPFLFYSGYGVWLSIQRKPGYVKTLPVKRAFKVWYHFALAVLLYYVTQLVIGKRYGWRHLLLSMIGVKGLGNSAWFVIVIVLLYLATFLAFTVFQRRMLPGTAATTLLCAALVLALRQWKSGEYWWYDTVLCYPLGMWFAAAEPAVRKFLLQSPVKWLAFTAFFAAGFYALHVQVDRAPETRRWFMAAALVFSLLLVLLSMRISVNNAVLRWFGKRVFGIYILQRIPMILLHHYFPTLHPVLFTAISLAVTAGLAELFARGTGRLDLLLHLSKPKASTALPRS